MRMATYTWNKLANQKPTKIGREKKNKKIKKIVMWIFVGIIWYRYDIVLWLNV